MFIKCFQFLVISLFLGSLTACTAIKELDDIARGVDQKLLTEEEIKNIEAKRVGFMVSLHEIVTNPVAKKIEKEVPTYLDENKKICINKNYFLHSKNIKRVERVKRDDVFGLYDLKLYLDMRGRIKYEALSMNFKGRKVGFLVDGIFYRAVKVEVIDDEDQLWTYIEGPFDKVISKKIVEKARVNYKHYNKGGFDRTKQILNFDDFFNPK